jgi:hypothetical protein
MLRIDATEDYRGSPIDAIAIHVAFVQGYA